jgi:putative chitinase
MITVGTLVIGGLGPTAAARIVAALVDVCARFGLSTPEREGGFVAQCAVESADFSRVEENLYYRTPERVMEVFGPHLIPSLEAARELICAPAALANRVYANRLGNGDEASGDGWRFRGRGFLQLTGCGLPFLEDPDYVATVSGAFESAASFWDRAGCSELADARAWDAITRKINGPAMLLRSLRSTRSIEFSRAFA